MLVADGTGSINAGVKMDANGNPIASGWKLRPGHHRRCRKQRQPSGFESDQRRLECDRGLEHLPAGSPQSQWHVSIRPAPSRICSTMPPAITSILTAGNEVQLGSTSYPRLDASTAFPEPTIYPGIVTINAGAGGVDLTGNTTYNQLILYPSPTRQPDDQHHGRRIAHRQPADQQFRAANLRPDHFR